MVAALTIDVATPVIRLAPARLDTTLYPLHFRMWLIRLLIDDLPLVPVTKRTFDGSMPLRWDRNSGSICIAFSPDQLVPLLLSIILMAILPSLPLRIALVVFELIICSFRPGLYAAMSIDYYPQALSLIARCSDRDFCGLF